MEIIETTAVPDRAFMSTPIDEFTVSEGLLLCIALLLIFGFVVKLIRGAF